MRSSLLTHSLAGILALAAMTSVASAQDAQPKEPPAAAAKAPEVLAITADALFASSFKDTSGTLQKFDDLKGKVAIVYFWATWCEPCLAEAPHLLALYESFKDKGLEVVGIAMDNADKVREFATKSKLTFKVVYGGREAMQLNKDLGNSLGAIPFMVVIDRDGKIVERIKGEAKAGRIEGLIAPLLAKSG